MHVLLLIKLSIVSVSAFQAPVVRKRLENRLYLQQESTDSGEHQNAGTINRRSIIQNAALFVGGSLIQPFMSNAEEEELASFGTDATHPIVVLGAGGKVGKLCTSILTSPQLQRYTRAVTRSGRSVLSSSSSSSSFVTYAPGDVTQYDSVKNAIQDASAVIFAASASGKNKGGDPAHVDYLGLYNTAKACLDCGIPKLVVISAGTVTRPDSIGFKATNLFVQWAYGEKIMDAKIAGEQVMRDLYSGQSQCSYCVIRPGGLSDSPALGPSRIHVSQGDVFTAEITREDVAQVTIAALLKGRATDFTTFELNNIQGLSKVMDSLDNPPASLIHAGASSYSQLLTGLLTDKDMKEIYPNFINDFRGDIAKMV